MRWGVNYLSAQHDLGFCFIGVEPSKLCTGTGSMCITQDAPGFGAALKGTG